MPSIIHGAANPLGGWGRGGRFPPLVSQLANCADHPGQLSSSIIHGASYPVRSGQLSSSIIRASWQIVPIIRASPFYRSSTGGIISVGPRARLSGYHTRRACGSYRLIGFAAPRFPLFCPVIMGFPGGLAGSALYIISAYNNRLGLNK